MNYVVFDLEWNQADPSKEEAHESLPFEIIEIGAIRLDENLKKTGTFHRVIKPVVYPLLFSHTREIVNLSDADLAKGTSFKRACTDFLKWSGENGDYTFCTWGPLDIPQLEMNMAWFGVENSFPRPFMYINAQQVFSISLGEEKEKAYSLEKAVEMGEIEENGEYHSALADATYTAIIMQNMDKALFKRYPTADTYRYPLTGEQEVYVSYPDHNMYITRAYSSREALKMAELHMPVKCNVCGKRIRRLIPWYTNNSKSYFAVGQCRDDGMVKIKRAIKNPDEKNFFEVQTVRKIDPEKATQIIKHHGKKR